MKRPSDSTPAPKYTPEQIEAANASRAEATQRLRDAPWKLPPYDNRIRCPKCWYDLVKTELHRNSNSNFAMALSRMGQEWENEWTVEHADTPTQYPVTYDAPLGAEIMLRTCCRCGWTTYQRPVDVEMSVELEKA